MVTADPNRSEAATEGVTAAPNKNYPRPVTDLSSGREFLIEARDVHQQWVDSIEHPLCAAAAACTDCDQYRVWLAQVEASSIGGADWHRRWVRNYDVILAALPADVAMGQLAASLPTQLEQRISAALAVCEAVPVNIDSAASVLASRVRQALDGAGRS